MSDCSLWLAGFAMPSLGPASGIKLLTGIGDRDSSTNVWRRAGTPNRELCPSFTTGLPRFPGPLPYAEPIAPQRRYAW